MKEALEMLFSPKWVGRVEFVRHGDGSISVFATPSSEMVHAELYPSPEAAREDFTAAVRGESPLMTDQERVGEAIGEITGTDWKYHRSVRGGQQVWWTRLSRLGTYAEVVLTHRCGEPEYAVRAPDNEPPTAHSTLPEALADLKTKVEAIESESV